MEFSEFAKEQKRMCESYNQCFFGCPMYCKCHKKDMTCDDFEKYYPQEAEQIVKEWSEEHPKKTILQDFLEKYPNAPLYPNKQSAKTCPCFLGYEDSEFCKTHKWVSCMDCWNRHLEDLEK